MKYVILLLIPLFLITACENSDITETQTTVSECDSYTSDYNIQRCKAIEAEDLSMCDPIIKYATRETCIQMIAEMIHDQSQLTDCSLSKNKNYQITCEALIKQDVDHCFTMAESVSSPSDIAMRDCIDLVARKMKDRSVCSRHVTNQQNLFDVCGGSTSDCEGQWFDGAEYNQESCEENI